MVAEMVPDKHKKLISHIRKTNERHKRQRRAKHKDSVSDVSSVLLALLSVNVVISSLLDAVQDLTGVATATRRSKPR